MTPAAVPYLKTCPFCGESLVIDNGMVASHADKSNGQCILSMMSFPVDVPAYVEKWNNRFEPHADQ